MATDDNTPQELGARALELVARELRADPEPQLSVAEIRMLLSTLMTVEHHIANDEIDKARVTLSSACNHLKERLANG